MKHRNAAGLALLALLTIPLLSRGTGDVQAAHVAPLVRDISMANLASNERELSIAVDPNNPNRLMAGSNQRGGTQAWFASSNGGRTWTNGALPQWYAYCRRDHFYADE